MTLGVFLLIVVHICNFSMFFCGLFVWATADADSFSHKKALRRMGGVISGLAIVGLVAMWVVVGMFSL